MSPKKVEPTPINQDPPAPQSLPQQILTVVPMSEEHIGHS